MLTDGQFSTLANQFRWLPTVDESMEAMLRAIQQAEASIRLEMYIFTASPIGIRFRDALVQAAERGRHVRVMVDSWGSITLTARFWQPLRQAGGEFRWFNPLSLGRFGIRDHRKLLVCDDSRAFIGGFNIAAEYEGDGVAKGWFDMGLEVEGSLARELGCSFDVLFNLADFRHNRFTALRTAEALKGVSSAGGQIILTGPGHSRHFLKSILRHDVRRANTIQIIAAYFLPLRPIRRALARAAKRGTRVQIVVAAKSDIPLLQLASRRFYQAFLRAGVEIYEYQPQILHAKLIVLDRIVYAGSANLDRRSFLANYELVLRITNPETAAQGREIFNKALDHSRRIEPATWKKSRSFWNKLKEHWAFFFIARVDPSLSRRQLRSLHSTPEQPQASIPPSRPLASHAEPGTRIQPRP